MTHPSPRVFAACLVFLHAGFLAADEPAPKAAADKTVEQLAESARQSVVVIRVNGRDGQRYGLGTGFVVGADGLIATNLHVIGEARPVTVRLADGSRHDVVTVEAFDRGLDLALVRIKAKGLTPLELGDSERLKQGQAVVAVGNPRGLERSIVAGVVSGKREIDGRPMIQLAIPLEPGNSGGPLLDLRGRVQGILTMKSLVTNNLGFAVGVNSLKPLLKRPNPVPMDRWLAIGALDPKEWVAAKGARWRQRGGRLVVDGVGSGFGGRSICLSQRPVPDAPYEVSVAVRLDDEAGAAGLIFHADGGDKHYGFYPTGGQLRLTRFEGPDVYSWKILHQETTPHYRPGEWNTLKVRVEKDRFRCYVNGSLIIESTDVALAGGKVGVAKFRETQAEFRHFQVGKSVRADSLPAELAGRVDKAIAKLASDEPPSAELIGTLTGDAPASVAALRERARRLEEQAARVRQLAGTVHQRRVHDGLTKLFQDKEEDVDLVHAALLVAKLDNDELDVDAYRRQIDRMAGEVAGKFTKDMDDRAKLDVLNKYLFTDNGFHGSRSDYYNRANSYLNEVLDDREGLPITLSVLYIELARRAGLRVEGVGLPGPFIVRFVPAKGEPQLIDVFEGGKAMSREDAAAKVKSAADRALDDADLAPVSKRDVIARMMRNLLGLAQKGKDPAAVLRYLDAILTVDPEAAEERGQRALVRFQTGRRREALEDVDWLLERKPEGLDVRRLREFRRAIERAGNKGP